MQRQLDQSRHGLTVLAKDKAQGTRQRNALQQDKQDLQQQLEQPRHDFAVLAQRQLKQSRHDLELLAREKLQEAKHKQALQREKVLLQQLLKQSNFTQDPPSEPPQHQEEPSNLCIASRCGSRSNVVCVWGACGLGNRFASRPRLSVTELSAGPVRRSALHMGLNQMMKYQACLRCVLTLGHAERFRRPAGVFTTSRSSFDSFQHCILDLHTGKRGGGAIDQRREQPLRQVFPTQHGFAGCRWSLASSGEAQGWRPCAPGRWHGCCSSGGEGALLRQEAL